MSRFTVRALWVSFSLASLTCVRADEPAPAPVPALTLDACVARAMQKNFTLQIQNYSTDVAREALNVSKTAFDPTFTATVTRSATEVAQKSSSGGLHSDSTTARLGVNQTIASGATVELSTGLDRASSNSTVYLLNPSYASDVALTVSQPLLRGAGLRVNRAQIERSKIGVTIALLDYRGQVLQVIRDTEVAYYNLVYARGQLGVKQHSLELAQRLLDENRTRKATGVATDLDVLSAEVGVANAQNGIITAEQSVRNSEDALVALIGQFEFDQPVGDVALTTDTEVTPTFDFSYKLARERQPDYLATQALIKQLELDVTTTKNAALPTVNVGGTLGYNGTDRTYGTAFNRMTEPDGYNWELDLNVSVPWGLRADRARLRSAQASLRQEEARLRQLDQNLLVEVRTAVRAVDTNRQSVEIYTKATQLAEKQYELELARFKAGLSTSRQVLQIQDDLEAARLNELSARVNLRTAIANLHQIESSSLDRYRVAIAE